MRSANASATISQNGAMSSQAPGFTNSAARSPHMTFNERLCVRAPVYGRHGIVVAGHSAATLAGISALKRGGGIIDAMVAASAALTVAVGQATSIGGDCFLLFHNAKSGRTIGLNGSGTA